MLVATKIVSKCNTESSSTDPMVNSLYSHVFIKS